MLESNNTGKNEKCQIGHTHSKKIIEIQERKLSAKNDRHGICLSMVCHS